ncbi:MAG TPA: hypothetical protein VFK33_13120 [Bacillales bacterium]|nr:hypothetical protein [Bacillales bacterium]
MRSIPLRAKYPRLYTQLMEKLEKFGLHTIDVKADILFNEKDTETISIKYGDQFREECHFQMAPGKPDAKLAAFLDETAEKCKKQAIEDYYTFMDIRPVKTR